MSGAAAADHVDLPAPFAIGVADRQAAQSVSGTSHSYRSQYDNRRSPEDEGARYRKRANHPISTRKRRFAAPRLPMGRHYL